MKEKKLKCYVLIVSRFFPSYHPRKGEETEFFEKLIVKIKLHTIRGNYPLWEKRIKEVNAGKAYISIRYWEGKPYKSKQIEFEKIFRAGIEKYHYSKFLLERPYQRIEKKLFQTDYLARNDGLSIDDFRAWFKPYKDEELAIIQLRNFNYNAHIDVCECGCVHYELKPKPEFTKGEIKVFDNKKKGLPIIIDQICSPEIIPKPKPYCCKCGKDLSDIIKIT